GLDVIKIHTDYMPAGLKILKFLFYPLMKIQFFLKERRALQKGGIDYQRIHKILLSDEILLGRHLILEVKKESISR
ncbi:MAG: hypothetical protein KC684_08080, partial [Candidatus Omnitrophica bacterium]|nr:hypothetical protein [Candidatus Omnitrophota bacterium]